MQKTKSIFLSLAIATLTYCGLSGMNPREPQSLEEAKRMFRESQCFRYKTTFKDERLNMWLEEKKPEEVPISQRDSRYRTRQDYRYKMWCFYRDEEFNEWLCKIKKHYAAGTEEGTSEWRWQIRLFCEWKKQIYHEVNPYLYVRRTGEIILESNRVRATPRYQAALKIKKDLPEIRRLLGQLFKEHPRED